MNLESDHPHFNELRGYRQSRMGANQVETALKREGKSKINPILTRLAIMM